MNHTTDAHDPTPEFRANLEWQIASALRRESRFAAPAAPRMGQLPIVLVVLAALAVGGAGGVASGQVQDTLQRNALITAAQSEEQLVRVRLELAKADYQQARRGFELGTVGRETLAAAERQVRAMETALTRIRLDIEEIKATSSAPRNELQAPLVKQRDFVRDRLALELENAQQVLVAAEQARVEAAMRVEIGTASQAAHLQAEADLALARERMQKVRAILDLRQRVLRGEIKAEDVVTMQRRAELTLQIERVQQQIQIARKRLSEVRGSVEVGMAAPIDFKRVEIEVLELEVELQWIRQELDRLGAVKRDDEAR